MSYQGTGTFKFYRGYSVDIKLNDVSIADKISGFRIGTEEGAFFSDYDLDFIDKDHLTECYSEFKSGVLAIKIIVNLDAEGALDAETQTYEFLVEQIKETDDGFSIWGRSKQAYLSSFYSSNIVETDPALPWLAGHTTLSEIIDYIIANYSPVPISYTLNIPDYVIIRGTCSISDKSPSEAIKWIVEEKIGAHIYPQLDGSFNIDPHVEIPITSVASYNGSTEIEDLQIDKEGGAKYDSVIVVGSQSVPPSGTGGGDPGGTEPDPIVPTYKTQIIKVLDQDEITPIEGAVIYFLSPIALTGVTGANGEYTAGAPQLTGTDYNIRIVATGYTTLETSYTAA